MKHTSNKMKSIEEVIQSVHPKDPITLKEYFNLEYGREHVNNYVYIMKSKDAKAAQYYLTNTFFPV